MSRSPSESLGPFQKARRVALALLGLAIFCALLFGQSVSPPEAAGHEAVEMIGVLLIVIGIAGRLWSTLYIGGRKARALVTDGPYSITRNPLYLFSSVAAVGVGAQMGSVTAALGLGLLCAAAFHVVIRHEERFLSDRLGPEYVDYMRRVPRFWPDLSIYREGDTSGFRPSALLATLLDGLLLFLAMPVFELIDAAQLAGSLPVLFRLP